MDIQAEKATPTDISRVRLVLVHLMLIGTLLLLLSGCSRLRIPRIDPSGNSIFLPAPNRTEFTFPQSSSTAGSNFAAPGIVQAPSSVGPIVPPALNGTASPPVAATPSLPAQQQPGLSVPTTIATPVPRTPSANLLTPAFQQPPKPPPCDARQFKTVKRLTPDPNRRLSQAEAGQIIMTPSKIVAPVGSEVVVLAGICGSDARFLKNQPLQWRLSPDSVGEIIEVGGMQHGAFNRLVPPTSKLVNSQFAYGRTGLKRLVLSRGTPACEDDIELAAGQTYISVSSPSPGISYVTGLAPNAEGWDRRRATTQIHWVDAQWSIPAPVAATAGTVTPLTTVLSRNDGSGVAGWPVRYSIVGGAAAEFAPSGSQTAEAESNERGQATVQIRQPIGAFEPGTTQVRVDVVRPPLAGQPEMIVESGITTVTWSAPALTIRAIGPRTAERDTPFNYRLEITNPGDQVARNVVVSTNDLGDNVKYISATPKSIELGRRYQWQIGDVVPNAQPKVVEIQLRALALGTMGLCFEVTSDTDRLQTEACAETEIVQPCLGLSIQPPQNARVGDEVTFLIRVENQCDQPLENVAMTIGYDPGLRRDGANPTTIRLKDPSGQNTILNVGDSRTFPFRAVAQAAGDQCISVDVTADGVRPERQQSCVTVVESTGVVTPTTPPVRTSDGALKIEAEQIPTPPSFGENVSTLQVRVTNQGTTPIENLNLVSRPTDALFPAFKPVETNRVGVTRSTDDNQVITNILRLDPGETIAVNYGYEGRRDDPNASVQVSVVSNQGGAVDTIRLPATTGTGGGAAEPNFGIPEDNQPLAPQVDPGNSGQGNIQPGPGAGVAEPVTVRIEPLSRQLQSGQRTKFAFLVRNNSGQVLNNVDIDFIVPNTLIYDGVIQNTLGLSMLPGFRLERILTLPANESFQGEFELVAGNLSGPATVQLQVKSDQTPVPLTDDATVTIQ